MSESFKAPTQADIALRAGVSQRAVAAVVGKSRPDSRVGVSEATRQRILQVAGELGYRPHRNAQRLRGVRSNLIGVLKTLSSRPCAAGASRRLVRLTRERGFGVVAHEMLWGRDELARAVEHLLDAGVEGLFLQGGLRLLDPKSRQALRDAGIPAVSVTGTRQPGIPFYGSDWRAAGRDGVRHFAKLGYGSVTLLMDERPNATPGHAHWEYEEYEAGFQEGCREGGLKESASAIIRLDRSSLGLDDYAPAREQVAGLVAAGLPRAVLCFRDAAAIGLIAGLREAGLSVPEDVAVLGFDGAPVGRHLRPALSTFEENLDAIVDRAAEDLFDLVSKRRVPQRSVVHREPCSLIVRESCGAGGTGGG